MFTYWFINAGVSLVATLRASLSGTLPQRKDVANQRLSVGTDMTVEAA